MNPSNEPTNQRLSHTQVNDVPNPIVVHFPDFKDAALSLAITSRDFAPCKKLFLDSNWITPELRRNVERFCPGRGEIDHGTGVRDTNALQKACAVLFQEGHIFASAKQLKQVTTLFLEKWSVKCVQHGKKLTIKIRGHPADGRP
jgi:hypothetical protein